MTFPFNNYMMTLIAGCAYAVTDLSELERKTQEDENAQKHFFVTILPYSKGN